MYINPCVLNERLGFGAQIRQRHVGTYSYKPQLVRKCRGVNISVVRTVRVYTSRVNSAIPLQILTSADFYSVKLSTVNH